MMRRLPMQPVMYRAGIALLFSFIACAFVWFSYITFHFPYIGVEVRNGNGNVWVVDQVFSGGAGHKLKLQPGDQILSINGLPTDRHSTVDQWRQMEQVESFVMKREGVMQFVPISIKENPVPVRTFLEMGVAFICLGLSIFLHIRRHQEPVSFLLARVFFLFCLIFMSLGASSRGEGAAKFLIMNSLTFLPFFFLEFLSRFLASRGMEQKPLRMLKWLYIVLVLVLILRISYFIKLPIDWFLIDRSMVLLFFGSGIILNIGYLLMVFWKNKNQESEVSTIIRMIWLALIISFIPAVFLSMLPMAVFAYPWLDFTYTVWFILLFPASFLYLFFAHRLFDIHLLLRRIFWLSCLAFVPAFLLAGVVYYTSGTQMNTYQLLMIVIAIFGITLAMFYLTERFNEPLKALFFPKKHSLNETLKEILLHLRNVKTFKELKEIVLVPVVRVLEIQGAAIVLIHREEYDIVVHGIGTYFPHSPEQLLSEDMGSEYKRYPIHEQKDYASFLILGRKLNGTILQKTEVDWIYLLNSYLSVILENLYLIEKLTMKLSQVLTGISGENEAKEFEWLRKSIFSLQEMERERIATDLHDTVMQDIYFVRQRLNLMQHKPRDQELDVLFQATLDHLEMININLRETCFELYPHLLLDVGFASALRKLVEQERTRAGYKLHLQLDGEEELEALNAEEKRHLFRIIQELLSNARKHSQATKVILECQGRPDEIRMTYEDNGVGLQLEKLEAPGKESGLGLMQIRKRAETMNGSLTVASEMNQGLRIEITFPSKGRL